MTTKARFSIGLGLGLAIAAALCVALAIMLVPRITPPDDQLFRLEPVSFDRLPGWSGDDQDAALASLLKSCDRLERLDPGDQYGPGSVARPAVDWIKACGAARRVPTGDTRAARAFFEARFEPFVARVGARQTGLLTGYFEPELRGSLERRAPYLTPLHTRPPDLVNVQLGRFLPSLAGRSITGVVEGRELAPYASRAQIRDGALDGRDLELLWVDDPVAAFFLEVQGSGRVRLEDGTVLRIGYAGKNGRPYTSIGRVLIDRGAIAREDMSLQALRRWLHDNPDQRDAILHHNESYVFFHILDGDGPLGSQGVVLTPGRSLAVDRGVWPMGMPVWIDGVLPPEVAGPDVPLRRLTVAQDTGGAITGALRGDLFWGPGADAERLAGHMKQDASFVVLLPAPPSVPQSGP
ncbi:MAG: murein transglycosylase A [Sphingomonadales bacterium]